jgi:hypothetical protein
MDNWQLTDEEVAAANKLLDRFFAQMMEVFSTRLDVVMANILGEKLAHQPHAGVILGRVRRRGPMRAYVTAAGMARQPSRRS